jgi:RNA polymerase sigma factor (sigma-70 family)
MRLAIGHELLAPLRAISPVGLDFPALFEKHYDEIVRYLKRRLMEPAIAEDIAQNTFVEAYDRRATYDQEKGSPRAWLFGIAIHLMQRHFRSERRRLRAYGRAVSRYIDLGDDNDEVCDRLDAHAIVGELAGALAALSRGDYEVLTMYCWAELSYEEIAIALQIPTGTVKSRLNRARRELRTYLSPTVLEPDHG